MAKQRPNFTIFAYVGRSQCWPFETIVKVPKFSESIDEDEEWCAQDVDCKFDLPAPVSYNHLIQVGYSSIVMKLVE